MLRVESGPGWVRRDFYSRLVGVGGDPIAKLLESFFVYCERADLLDSLSLLGESYDQYYVMRTAKPSDLPAAEGMLNPARWAYGMTRKEMKRFPDRLRSLAARLRGSDGLRTERQRKTLARALEKAAENLKNVNGSESRSITSALESEMNLEAADLFWRLPETLSRLSGAFAEGSRPLEADIVVAAELFDAYAVYLEGAQGEATGPEREGTPLAGVKRAELEVYNLFLGSEGKWRNGPADFFRQVAPLFEAVWRASSAGEPLISFQPKAICARLGTGEPYPFLPNQAETGPKNF